MAHKDDLRLAFSGKEIASERIALIESTIFENETAEQFSRERCETYQKVLEQSEKKISEIKSRIAEYLSTKKFENVHFFASDRYGITECWNIAQSSIVVEHERSGSIYKSL